MIHESLGYSWFPVAVHPSSLSLFEPSSSDAVRYESFAHCPVTGDEILPGMTYVVEPGYSLPDPLPYRKVRITDCEHCDGEHELLLSVRKQR